jgi:PAS domain S-box-containing protein
VVAPAETVPDKPGSSAWSSMLERIGSAFDQHAIIAVTDAAGTITYANEGFCRVSEYSRDELVGRKHRILKSGRHPAAFYEGMWRTITSGRVWRDEVCNRAKSGRLYWVEATIVPCPGPGGKPCQYVAFCHETTRLKEVEKDYAELAHELEERVEQRTRELEVVNAALHHEMEERRVAADKLAKSERLYRFLFQSVTDYFYTVEVRGGCAIKTVHSPGCASVTGYTPEDFATDPMLWIKMVVPEDRPAVEEQARLALLGQTPAPLEHRIVTKGGERRWIRNTVVVRRDDQARVAFYDGIISDVTEQRQAQEQIQRLNEDLERRVAERTAQLRASNEQFRIVFEQAPVGIGWVEFGPPDRFHLNDRFCQIIDLTAEEAEDFENIMRATHPDDREPQRRLMRELAEGKRDRFLMEKRYVRKDGRVVLASLLVVVLRDERGQIRQEFAMIEDITERRAAEQREAAVRERDLATAREVQRHLLPNAAPDVPEFDVGGIYVPSSHIGGDYYDYFQVAPRRWAFAVADVSGKGASAALVMASCRTALRIEAARHPSPAALLRSVNRFVHPDMPEGMFISIAYGLLDLDTRELALARAGHEAPLVVRGADGSAAPPCPSALALGLDAGPLFDETLEEQAVKLGPGDLLVLYTDGITETANERDEEFGAARLLETVAGRRGASAAEITRAVDAALSEFAGGRPPVDDRTLVVVRMR